MLLGTGHLADPDTARKISVDEVPYTGLALGTAEIAHVVVQQTVTKKHHSSAAFIRHMTPEALKPGPHISRVESGRRRAQVPKVPTARSHPSPWWPSCTLSALSKEWLYTSNPSMAST